MTKHWIGYHNVNKTKMSYRALPESVLYTNANGNPHAGDIVWVIEGVGNKSPKLYRLVDCFIVETMDTVIPPQSFNISGGVSKSMLKKSRLNFDKIEKCK